MMPSKEPSNSDSGQTIKAIGARAEKKFSEFAATWGGDLEALDSMPEQELKP